MKYHLDKDAVKAAAKRVLLMMAQHDVPVDPENYWLWFDYVNGANKELQEDINQIIKGGGTFSNEFNEEIYKKHFVNHVAREKLVQGAQKEIQKILQDILVEILHTQNFTSYYRTKLEEVTEELKIAKGLDEIQHIVTNLILVTVDVIHESEQLKEHLTETNEMSDNLQKELENAQQEILIDTLTSLFNRKAFDKKIQTFMMNFQQEQTIFSVVMIDIDSFKQFNDQFGHLLGDQVLKFMGTFLSKELKGKDFVARYGGEEFVILLEGTSVENACLVANKLRNSLAGMQLKYVKTGQILGKINISAGVSAAHRDDTAETLLQRADAALYLAKQTGRNNVKSELDFGHFHLCESSAVLAPSMVEFREQ